MCGFWRLQSANPSVIRVMSKRVRTGDKWKIVGRPASRGSPYIFLCHFEEKGDAVAAFNSIIKRAQGMGRKTDKLDKHTPDPHLLDKIYRWKVFVHNPRGVY